MSSQEHVENFNEIMKGKSWWARLLGTQFSMGVALFVGQMVERCEALSRRLLQEAFLSTAVKRSSILAAAEDRGHVGRKIMPSTGTVRITNKSAGVLLLPYGTPLSAPNQLNYVISEAVRVQPGQSVDASVAQLEEVVITTTVIEEQKWLEVLLPKDVSAKAAKLDVLIAPPGKQESTWEKRFQFRRSGPDSKVYTEFYKATEQLGIRFGNGLSGMVPLANSKVRLVVWCSVGDSTLVEGQPMELAGQPEAVKASVTIATITPIAGGAAGESTEDIRRGALYVTPYDEQIVWDNDYRHFIRRNIPGISWLRVWGEVQQEKESGYALANIGKIFISAYSPTLDQARLKTMIISLFESTKELNRRHVFVPVNRQPFTIEVTGTLLPRQQKEVVRQALVRELAKSFGENAVSGATDSSETDKEIYEKDIWTRIDALDLMEDFTVKVIGRKPAPKLADYVFLDAATSGYDLRYKEDAI